MDEGDSTRQIGNVVNEFVSCIESLPAELFLAQIDDWTPRDVLTHLIGWNRYTIGGCQQIRRGETPAYFADAPHDFAHVNAEFVKEYSSRDRRELLAELERSFEELELYLMSVDPSEWHTDHGVRYAGYTITIGTTVGALAGDYVIHQHQIETWVKSIPDAM